MSLTVPPELIDQAAKGKVDEQAFVDCVRDSLPYAWSVVTRLVDELHATDAKATYNEIAPPDEKGYGQLFRMLASTSIRGAMERHFGVQLAFQNCCKVAVFQPDATEEYAAFITLEAQILNQKPELVDC
ncbi:SCO5389 family protein [Kibdelosporangium philippinense]|uniref:SCO5389 family protein n=1 Tax=Kibdelosporangium philippinense TaxID=211113 RepID=A0ABS8Z5V9_9PSEU|nr:SCO5389 family protein [Kibdelosporangium philippinense]MCE7002443.1 SCO5389 family protein [Kibdelosporangium philippinense]